jgi:hypothetical protein
MTGLWAAVEMTLFDVNRCDSIRFYSLRSFFSRSGM